MTKYFLDTCSLLNCYDYEFQEPFIISEITCRELEDIKSSSKKDYDIKYKARRAAKWLYDNYDKYEVVLYDDNVKNTLAHYQMAETPDNIIVASAIYYNNNISPIEFVSDDLCCSIIGRAYNLVIASVCGFYNSGDRYLGYKTVTLTDNEMAYFYGNLDVNMFGCLINEYLILKNKDGVIADKYKWNGNQYVPLSYKQISNEFIGKIKPRNVHQELAFDMLQDNKTTIKVLTGKAGSGKDLLMISTALQLIKTQKFKKLLWVRNNIEVKDSKTIGYLPGTKKEKLLPYAMILADHLGGIEGLESLMIQGQLELEHLGLIRGRDIKDTIIMCSESENTTKDHIQLLISRIGDGSALWINGDFQQIDSNVFECNNGLSAVIQKLRGNPYFGFVEFQICERSETAKLADLLN